jgi:SRSO17 transposase
MTPAQLRKLDRELTEFLDYITDEMGRPERRRAMSLYLTGLLLEGERKTAKSMGRRLAEHDGEVEGMRQRLQQCVSVSDWADEEVRRRLAWRFEQRLKPEAFIVDDTGFPKKGRLSVGVKRQYSGTLGRTDNCQVAPSLHVATDGASGCIGMRLYLPEEWANDQARREQAGVPDDVVFKPKGQIALDLLDEALGWGLPPRLVIADAGYGDSTEFRDGLDERGCPYLVGISGNHCCWPPGSQPRQPNKRSGPGRPRTRYRAGTQQPIPIADVATQLTYRKYTVPDGRGGTKTGRFAFARVQLAERHTKGRPPSDPLWLICEWRPAKKEYRYHVANLAESTPKHELVRLTKLRWRVERDYQEMKGEIGLDHYEGRSWRGFHHHAKLCAVAHGFLAIQRQLFPPVPPENARVDAADGATPNSAPAAGTYRNVPTLPKTVRRDCQPLRAVTHVTP